MGSFLIVLALLFSLLLAIVAVANHQPVEVNYIFGETQIPLIVLIIGAAAAGALVVGLISLYRGIRDALQARAEKKRQDEFQQRLESLEAENSLLRRKLERLQAAAEPETAAAKTPEEEKNTT